MWTAAHGVGHRCLDAAATRADLLWHNQMRELRGVTAAAVISAVWHHGVCERVMHGESRWAACEGSAPRRSVIPPSACRGMCTHKNIWTRHHQTHMPFCAAINRSEGAFWCVGVHSHILISTAVNGEESGATATKGKANIYCNSLPARSRNNTNRILGCNNTRNIQERKK
ncbi:hypothetical protein Tc00.1047053503417.33 [Trypanosoma cruzi]|uniref:Uncharacterized protein n=1 Tax=Trypanosoma cruzi (strain CL Brener) TaxID=353153 RepID=Q4D0G1_TRYCC|nr:hypothetical protein Tc00.1047053503417.33 [Trypanosoma cruzi]EAN86015.1 hypothetical protein Tc00.1047053503417.33 [Trypanosoma cruzi]|eukprot:XP_807866.1 hypothetical protein [Trypanosoma cruzi strain CL Brener]